MINGDYAVIVTENNCTDTSTCTNINVINVDQITGTSTQIRVYPNPTSSAFTLDLGCLSQKATVQLRDFTGRLVREQYYVELQQTQWFLDRNLPKGVYLLSIQIQQAPAIYRKIIKQ